MTAVWVPLHLVQVWHERLIRRFGGVHGLRDPGLLESALARAQNLAAYEPASSIERLAAAYAFGLARDHPFVDGNKRIAFAVMAAFLKANGRELDVPEIEATRVMLELAAGELTEADFTAWLARNTRPDASA